MKRVRSRVGTAVRTYALDWFTAALAATAVALFILALARAAGAEHGSDVSDTGAASRLDSVEVRLERRMGEVAGDFGLYLENLERTFYRDIRSLENEVGVMLKDYDGSGQGRREFDRRLKALDVRLDQLSKRVGRLRTTMPVPRAMRPY
jgi:hypothetical protein